MPSDTAGCDRPNPPTQVVEVLFGALFPVMTNRDKSSHEPPAMAVNLSRMQVWMPSPVHALATNPDRKVVAVGREDGDIELTVPSEGYRVEARIPGQKGKGLRSLVWMEGNDDSESQGDTAEDARLFGCGLDGTVFEADLVRLCYKNVRDVYGGSAWCMRVASELGVLAVGCDDGSVRLFSTEGGGVEYKRSLSSTGSRVLSLAWGPGNDTIFAGCADSLIHCLDAASGQGLVSGYWLQKAPFAVAIDSSVSWCC